MNAPRTFRLQLELPAEFGVGEWAGAVRVAADRVPRQIEREVAAALRTVAVHLGVPLVEIGPRSRCSAYCHRYGPATGDPRAADAANHGRPLCPACQATAVAAARGPVSPTAEPVEPARRAA